MLTLQRQIKKARIRLSNAVLKASPPSILVAGYVGLIVAGTILLKLQIATHKAISWLDALFTATSAVTVTGRTCPARRR